MKASPHAHTIVRGVMPDGARVRAFARTNAPLNVGDEVASIELPVEVEADSTHFAVYADADALPNGFMGPEGDVDVQVVAESAEGVLWIDHTSAQAVREGSETEWTIPQSSPPGGQRLHSKADPEILDGVPVGQLARVGVTPVPDGARRAEAADFSTKVIAKNWVDTLLGSVYLLGTQRLGQRWNSLRAVSIKSQ